MRSSVKAAYNRQADDLIEQTRAVWQPRLGRDLTRDEAKQITANITGFFAVLAEWVRTEAQGAEHDAVSRKKEARDDS